MAVLTSNMDLERKDPNTLAHPVAASTKIYSGAIVCENASHYAVNGADTSGLKFLGIAVKQADNSNGSAGAIDVKVYRTGNFKLPTAISTFRVGDKAYVADNGSVTDGATATNDVLVGTVSQVVSGAVWVDIAQL